MKPFRLLASKEALTRRYDAEDCQPNGTCFENAGVTAKLANPYFGGTLLTQAKAIARHAGFDMFIDKNTMAIVPPKKSRSGGAIVVSPETGMVGYPQFNQAQVIVTALYSPEYKIGGISKSKAH